MEILLYFLIGAIILLLYFLFKNTNWIITIICSLLIIQIILAPQICIDGVISGTLLFFYKVFPSLFSFLVVCNIILCYDGINIYSRLIGKILCKPLRLPVSCSFVIIISILCGYPLGAKYSCELYEKNIIDSFTCERLLNIASNASPIFILGSVGISMLKNSFIGYILLLSNLISCIVMGLLIPTRKTYKEYNIKKNHTHTYENIGKSIKKSIEGSLTTCTSIGGFIIIFSVINNILKHNFLFNSLVYRISSILGISKDIVEGTLLGIIEMTNGCSLISSSTASITLKLIIISFLFTFSGISIISQVYSFTYKFKISMKKYIVRKIFQGIICSITSFLLYNLSFHKLSTEAFLPNYKIAQNISNVFIFTFILLTIPWIIFKLKELFHIS
ncbi:sporulation integral membrane protein YlbJ [Clostridium sp. WILCCON 0269]|uniref:Sporulation integral membrane protein YlbJ n=1 Tax=Candidatus Clostridium eludens TaxID=3381663 RepID=A0ABW8SIW7_9CLOT